MSLKVYMHPLSQPARAVSWACAHESTPVEEAVVNPGKDTRTGEYAEQGPILSVPRLVEDGFVLNESHAIMCYLGDKFEWKLYPAEAKVRARIHQYMNWHHQNTRRIAVGLFAPVVRPDIPISKEQIVQEKAVINATLKTVERWLATSKWLCGDCPTVADLSCYCEIGPCQDKFMGLFTLNGINLDSYPHMVGWLEACEQLPGYEKSHEMLRKASPKIRKAAERFASKL